MQVGLFQPSAIHGSVTGQFSVLNGLLDGLFKHKLEIGEKCDDLPSEPFAGVRAIAALLPGDKAQGVPLYREPVVTFTMPMGKIQDTKVYLKKFELTQKGQKVAGKVKIANDGYSATYEMDELLLPNTEYRLEATVAWKKYKNGEISKGEFIKISLSKIGKKFASIFFRV